jgi:uncharacterized membrane protein
MHLLVSFLGSLPHFVKVVQLNTSANPALQMPKRRQENNAFICLWGLFLTQRLRIALANCSAFR